MAGSFLRRKFSLPTGGGTLFRVDDETQLKGMCHWQPGKRPDAPVIVIVHGLEGSCDSKYAHWNCGQGIPARLSCRAHESAELRRHRTADADVV